MDKLWQDQATGAWFRRIAATEAIVAATGKSWVDVPVNDGPHQPGQASATPVSPDKTKKAKEDRDDIAETALDAVDLGLDIVGSGLDAGLGLIGDIAGGLADLS
jgi:hypothetical protein